MDFCLTAFGWSLLQPGELLRVCVDNRVAMNVINGFTSRSPALIAELRRLYVVVASLGVFFKTSWPLSRMRDRDALSLCAAVGARLDKM